MKLYMFGGLIAFGAGIVALCRSNDALGVFFGIVFLIIGAMAIEIDFREAHETLNCVDEIKEKK